MPVSLKTLQYDPTVGHDRMIKVADLAYTPSAYDTKEAAAKGFYAALNKFAVEAGFGATSVRLWSPDDAAQRGYGRNWMVSWEEGPYEFAIHLSYQIHNMPKWYTEPHHSFDLCFVD